MAKFITISGPSSTGKTTLVDTLGTYPELSGAVFSPDLYNAVWSELVDQGYFTEFSEINRDTEYLCVYILRLIDYYEGYIKAYENTDKLVILDGCWFDVSVYAILNMWYTRVIKEVQESILSRLNNFDTHVSRMYITSFDESKHVKLPNRSQFRMANLKLNRPLELQYYGMAKHFKNSIALPSSDSTECAMFILDDLRKLGYL